MAAPTPPIGDAVSVLTSILSDWGLDIAKAASGACAIIIVALIRSKTSFATAVAHEARKQSEVLLKGYSDHVEALMVQNKDLLNRLDHKDEEIVALRQALDALPRDAKQGFFK